MKFKSAKCEMEMKQQETYTNIKEKKKAVDEKASTRIRYMNFIIISFAKGAKMWIPEAYKYLRDFGGLDFLYRHYEYEHTLPSSETHFTLLKVCRNNGGWL